MSNVNNDPLYINKCNNCNRRDTVKHEFIKSYVKGCMECSNCGRFSNVVNSVDIKDAIAEWNKINIEVYELTGDLIHKIINTLHISYEIRDSHEAAKATLEEIKAQLKPQVGGGDNEN